MKVRSGVLLLSFVLLSTASAAPRDAVKFAGVLEQMRGHYDAMLSNHQKGDMAMALKHSRHPANELYDAVKADLSPALQSAFKRDYARIEAVLAGHKSTSELSQALNTFSRDVDKALATVPAATRQDPKYGARVIALILGNTKTEYGSGVSAGKVANLAEYQDAQFYLAGAGRWLAQYMGRFPADQGGQAATAVAQARTLHLSKADPKIFNVQIDRARTELAEISGDTLAPTTGPAADFATIRELLTQAKDHYAGGMQDAANEALISAYLDHFEQLESPLAAKNKALEQQLETTLRDTLRGLVKQKVSAPQFSAAVDQALADLRTAQDLLK
ncbi:hypothetical protein [Deinococcus humi]|uniref:DUF3829 domain-containing protein n=1 Tax=Deinococcus humi TaxID=662880 RepID=A0A7W8JYR3_9DEIO|nr:hypothetical protein [Deinococcus humi]MBB5364398.1 hypothetical protein [Deinococcus humi]GGO33265.1 hypothetical protein GCM10008949_32190 [Deinococcus humi]